MPVQISVGPPTITVNESNTFMVIDLNGEISPDTEHGVFHDDTRYISTYRLFASGKPWVRLSSSPTAYNAARIYLTNQAIPSCMPARQDSQAPSQRSTSARTCRRPGPRGASLTS